MWIQTKWNLNTDLNEKVERIATVSCSWKIFLWKCINNLADRTPIVEHEVYCNKQETNKQAKKRSFHSHVLSDLVTPTDTSVVEKHTASSFNAQNNPGSSTFLRNVCISRHIWTISQSIRQRYDLTGGLFENTRSTKINNEHLKVQQCDAYAAGCVLHTVKILRKHADYDMRDSLPEFKHHTRVSINSFGQLHQPEQTEQQWMPLILLTFLKPHKCQHDWTNAGGGRAENTISNTYKLSNTHY